MDSERCSWLDLIELVEAEEVDCDETFSDVFFSVDEITFVDWEEDSSTFELLIFAFELLIKFFETSVVLDVSVLEAETDDFFELIVLEEEATELFLTAELILVAADDAFDVDSSFGFGASIIHEKFNILRSCDWLLKHAV